MANTTKDLIELLRQKRELLNMNRNKLSTISNVSHLTVARMENYETEPSISKFIQIANALGYDVTLQNIKETKTTEDNELINVISKYGYKIIDNDIFKDDIIVLEKEKDIRR